jgi:hypothetical protein
MPYLNGLKAAELVIVKHHINAVGIGIHGIPYQLGHRKNWLADLRNPLKVVVLDLNLKGLAGHGSPLVSKVYHTPNLNQRHPRRSIEVRTTSLRFA